MLTIESDLGNNRQMIDNRTDGDGSLPYADIQSDMPHEGQQVVEGSQEEQQ